MGFYDLGHHRCFSPPAQWRGERPHLVPPAFIERSRTPVLLGRSRIGINLELDRRLV